jgi:hypothetical protein
VNRTIYFLRNAAGEVLYIGCTYNLRSRLYNIRRNKLWWSDVADLRFYDVPEELAADEEQAAISHFRPLHNQQGVTKTYRKPVPLHGPRTRPVSRPVRSGHRSTAGLSPTQLLEVAS